MKPITRYAILTGGILNLLLALFHIFLCYQIYVAYGTAQVYPLLQALAVGGALLVAFLAYTSLFTSQELVTTKTGTAVIVLNILVYLTRTVEDFILFPKPNLVIVVLCSILTLLYGYVLFNKKKAMK